MDAGLRVELGVTGPGACPVAGISDEMEASVSTVSRASVPDPDGQIAEEFTVEGGDIPASEEVSEVAAYNERTVYRFQRPQTQCCVCEYVEAFGYPVLEVYADDGTLYVSFHAPDVEAVQEVVNALRERFSGVHPQNLTRVGDDSEPDLVFVDRSRLTARQREVLQTAYDMGYFEHPKGANAGEVAAELGISPSTFSEHLAAAQGKLLEAIVTA